MTEKPTAMTSTANRPARPGRNRVFAYLLALSFVSPLMPQEGAARSAPATKKPGPLAAEPAAAARGRGPERWYAATVAKDDSANFLMVHFWSKGSLFRSEAVVAGRPIVTIVDHSTYYIFERVSGRGVAIERSALSMEQDATRGRPFANELEDLLKSGGELIETRQTAVGPVDIFRATNAAGRRTVWMSTTPPRVPLQVETFDRATSTTGRIDYINWMYGPEIPDAFFEPAANIEFEEVSYRQYKRRVGREAVGPAPVLYRHLLHGHE